MVVARLELFLRKENLEAEEMTRLLKCFPYEAWEPELISQHPCKKQDMLVYICNPKAEQDEMRDSLMLERQASQTGELQVQCETQLQTTVWWAAKTFYVDLLLLCEYK